MPDATQVTERDAKKWAKNEQELGETGTLIVGGIITESEYNKDLSDPLRAVEVFDEMHRGDATVRAALQVVMLPILAAEWSIEPASEDKADQDVAEFVRDAFFNQTSRPWADTLRQALSYLKYGFATFEIVYKFRDDGLLTWHKFAPRLQKTIQAWEMENGEKGIQQNLPSGGVANIPIEKLVILTNEKEGDNYFGVSLLRSAYKHWYIKDRVYRVDAIAHERQGVGVPVAYWTMTPSAEQEAEVETLLRKFRANEEAHLQIKTPNLRVEMMDMKGGTSRNPQFTIEHHDRQIMKAVLAQFMELGRSSSGSFALSTDHSRLFLLSLEAIANSIAESFNKFAIRRLVDLNFDVEAYPKLTYSKIGDTDVNGLSTAIQRLMQVGALTADDMLESHLRRETGLPQMDEASARRPVAPETALEATEKVEQLTMRLNDAIDSTYTDY